MILTLNRQVAAGRPTHGKLYVDGAFRCLTLEDPVREIFYDAEWHWQADFKVLKETAIPSGRYEVIINKSPRFKRRTPFLLKVPDFTDIRFHSGNVIADTEGCILVGQIRSGDTILQSRAAFDPLFTLLDQALKAGKVHIDIVNQIVTQ